MKSSSRLSSGDPKGSTSEMGGGLKFFHDISPAMDFQLGGLSFQSPATGIYNQFASFGVSNNNSSVGSPLMGFSNYPQPLPSVTTNLTGAIQDMDSSLNVNSNLASSIESLSSINQDLHWKLQQQRLATMLFDGGEQNQAQQQKPLPILFQNLEVSKPENVSTMGNPRKSNETAKEWFFGNSYATPTTSSNGNDNNNTSNWNGVQVQPWNDLNQYTTLP
ncbi:hypothetical protein V6Z11_A02G173000 [Gossypium hirsutum]